MGRVLGEESGADEELPVLPSVRFCPGQLGSAGRRGSGNEKVDDATSPDFPGLTAALLSPLASNRHTSIVQFKTKTKS